VSGADVLWAHRRFEGVFWAAVPRFSAPTRWCVRLGAMTAPLGFVVCGAPLAARSADVARSLVGAGWDLSIGVTGAAAEWINP
jgi:hypothetical protein